MIRNLTILGLALMIPLSTFAETSTATTQKSATPTTPTFTIEYASDSPIKTIPLNNTGLKIKIYYNNNPRGIMTVTTDENKNFTIEKFKDQKALVLEVLALVDEKKYNARCHEETISDSHIKLICTERKKTL